VSKNMKQLKSSNQTLSLKRNPTKGRQLVKKLQCDIHLFKIDKEVKRPDPEAQVRDLRLGSQQDGK